LLNNGEQVIFIKWHILDKIHQTLQADMLVSDKEITCLVDGSGNCIEIESGVVAIGSGGLYAQCNHNQFYL